MRSVGNTDRKIVFPDATKPTNFMFSSLLFIFIFKSYGVDYTQLTKQGILGLIDSRVLILRIR